MENKHIKTEEGYNLLINTISETYETDRKNAVAASKDEEGVFKLARQSNHSLVKKCPDIELTQRIFEK